MAKKKTTKPKINPQSSYRPEHCDAVVILMRDGLSITEVAAALGVGRQTIYDWRKAHPEFNEAIDKGTELSQAWWERLGRDGAYGRNKDINATVWIFNMKNRFGWRDKQDVDHNVRGELHVKRIIAPETPK